MENALNPPIGILGGTFDPIHLGHIQLAQLVLERLQLDKIYFIPNYRPPHRNIPIASPTQRLTMVTIALEEYPKLHVDDREMKRQGISYTIDTLKALRTDFPNTPLCWIMGLDEFAKLNTWYHFQELDQYANFIVINRNNVNITFPKEINHMLQQNEIQDPQAFQKHRHGKIYQLHIPPFEISATEIRTQLAQNQKPDGALSKKVYEYIKKEKLYFSEN